MLAGVAVPLAGSLSGALGGVSSTGRVLASRRPLPTPFTQRLTLPRVLEPVSRDADGDHYRLTQAVATAAILPGVRTPVWGYGGTFPGPTIVSSRGRATTVTHTNALPVPTVVHLHGGRTPSGSDGFPTDLVAPGASRSYRYPLEQRAAALWYHDHRMDFTGPSVWRGLAGFHLVRDEEEAALHLPSGPRELPLMLTDRSFEADGSLRYPSRDPSLLGRPGVTDDYVAGVLGDVMLVNGTPWPRVAVDAAAYRLRLLNACNARRVDLRLDPAPEGALVQVGTDGGLLGVPLRHDHVELAPAQRCDLVVDFSAYPTGTEVTLHDDFGDGEMGRVMRFVVGAERGAAFSVPDRLSTIEPLRAADAVVTRTFRFRRGEAHGRAGWLIGEEPFGPDQVVARPRLGTVEVWRLMADFHHPVHLHLSPFQVLSRGTEGPGAFDAGWRDTLDLRPSEQASIAVRFEGYAGRYVFHCHNLEHEDMAMMATFETH